MYLTTFLKAFTLSSMLLLSVTGNDQMLEAVKALERPIMCADHEKLTFTLCVICSLYVYMGPWKVTTDLQVTK